METSISSDMTENEEKALKAAMDIVAPLLCDREKMQEWTAQRWADENFVFKAPRAAGFAAIPIYFMGSYGGVCPESDDKFLFEENAKRLAAVFDKLPGSVFYDVVNRLVKKHPLNVERLQSIVDSAVQAQRDAAQCYKIVKPSV